ncbi:MAG: hypothetical protein M1814_001360 [Vezdaea aestivalis]|nr:MAG: hypothetical protein M1814_001360 [Vezdaea aestivalis]
MSNGKSASHRSEKVKFSTMVPAMEIAAFYERYAEVCKAGMSSGLRKRDRSGRSKKKSKKVGASGVKKN